MKSRLISTALLAATAFSVAACSDDEDPVGAPDNNTTVRFINATTGGSSLDIAQNGTVSTGNGNLAFGSASTCTKVNNTNPQLAVRTAGSTTNLAGFTPSFTANNTYTVLVTGTTAAPVFTQLDDKFATPAAGNAVVRIVNATSVATAGAGNWDIFVNPGTTLGTPNATAIGRSKASDYLTVPAGQAYTIRLTNTGQTTRLQDITVPIQAAGTAQTIVVGDAATGSTTLRTFTFAPCT